MKKETRVWLNKAEEDLDTAKFNFKGEKYEPAIFFCQQSAEKAMKAALLEHGGELVKTHDLVLLANKLKAPKDVIEHAKELTFAYTYTRYPDLPEIKDIKERAEEFLNYAESVIEWIKKSLQN